MSTLVAVVEDGSLSAASRRLRVPLSTISRRVADLETHLGTALVTRTSRRLELTDAGTAYVLAAKRILSEVDEAELVASGEYSAPRGTLAITAPIVFGRLHILPVVSEFLFAQREISIDLTLADRVVDLIEEHVDVALRIGALADNRFHATRVGEVRLIVCASPQHLAEHGAPAKPADLRHHNCVAFGAVGSAQSWLFDNAKPAAVSVRPRLTVTTAEAAVDAAIASVGVTRVFSYQATSAIRSGALVRILQDFEPPAIPVNLVHTGQALMPLKTRAFLDFAVARLRKRTW